MWVLGLAKMTNLMKTGLVLLFPFLIRPILYKQAAVSSFLFLIHPLLFHICFLSMRPTLSTFSALIPLFFLFLFHFWLLVGTCYLVLLCFNFLLHFQIGFLLASSGRPSLFVLWHLVRAGIRGVSGRISLFCFLDWGFIISFFITLGCGGLLFFLVFILFSVATTFCYACACPCFLPCGIFLIYLFDFLFLLFPLCFSYFL